MRALLQSRWWSLFGLLAILGCGSGEPTVPGDPPGGAKPTLPGVPSILTPIAGKFRITGKENPDCHGQSGFWTFCQHESALHSEGNGIQASDDTYAWDINRVGPAGEINADLGQTVFSVEEGRVVKYGGSVPAGTDECKSLLIEHSTNGTTWWSGYLHMSAVLVDDGQLVTAKTPIGKVGGSCVTNDHLHFVVYTGTNTLRGLLSRDVDFVERVISLPLAPSALNANSVSSSEIALSWTTNSPNGEEFRIEACAGSACSSFSEVASVDASVTTYQHTGLSASTQYRYRVRASNTVGNSDYSNIAIATTPALIVPPPAPTNLSATAPSVSQVNLSWTDNSTTEDGYRIERCTGSGCSDFAEIATAAINATTYQNTGLVALSTYRYRVRAYNTAGNSAYSSVLTIATPSGITIPTAPNGLSASATSASQINLAWTDNATTEDGYRIERCVGAGCSNFVEIATSLANVTGYQNTGLMASTTYQYRVNAYNVAGTSGLSSVASATTHSGITLPLAPSDLISAAQSSSRIDLAWTDNATNEDSYKVERCSGAGCSDFAEIATLAANSVSYQNLGLTGSTTYRFRIRAVNTAGNSAYSATATTTTPMLVVAPSAPTGLAAVAQSSSQISLTWTDNATNEDTYNVERCIGAACSDFAEIASVAANSTSYQSVGLAGSTTYRYRVLAVNTAGRSASTAVSATTQAVPTPPAPPTGLSAAEQSPSRIDLAWTDNASNETGYAVERCIGAGCTDFSEIATLPSNTTHYQNTGLTGATTYTYRVRAVNTAGNSSYSNTTSVTTTSMAPSVTTTAATGVTESSFNANGLINPNGTETSAYFELSSDPSFSTVTTTSSSSIGSGNSPVPVSATVNSNLCGTTFYYRAVAVRATAETTRGSAFSTTLSACTIPATPTAIGPGAANGPGPTLSSNVATLSWSLVSNATYYNVVLREVQSNAVVFDQNSTTGSLTVTFVGIGGREYRWSVTACNPAGCNATYSSQLFFMTPP